MIDGPDGVGADVGNHKGTRRGNREGRIGRRKDGRWYAASFLGYGVDGKKRYKWHYAATNGEVLDKKRKFERERDEHAPAPPARLTVSRYLTDWIAELKGAGLAPHTWVSYELQVRRYLVPGLGRVKLVELQPKDVREFLQALLRARSDRTGRPLSASSVQRVHATLRRALSDAVQDGILSRNVAKQARGVTVEGTHERALTLPQAKQLLAVLRGHPDEVLYRLDVSYGLRQGELLGLSWSDVDLDEGLLHVRRQLQRTPKALRATNDRGRGTRYVLRDLKTKSKAYRTLPLPEPLLSALQRHRRRQIAAQLAAGPAWRNEFDLVFTTSIGTPRDGRNVTKRFQRILEASGLPRFVFHELRHSAATLLLAQGVAIRTIMDILGHTQERTTNRYAHRVPALQADAAGRLQAALGAEMGPDLGEQLVLFGGSVSESVSTADVVAFPGLAEGSDRA